MAPPHWWLNRSPSSWGNVSKNWRASRSKVAGRWSRLAGDPPAEVVDRVVAAPEDPVVRGEPVVVELVAGVVDALPVAASRSRPAARPTAARSSARSRRPAPCASGPASRATGTRWCRGRRGRRAPCGRTRSAPPRPRRPWRGRDVGVLVDPDAEPLGGVGQPPGQPGRVHQRVVVAVPEAGEVRRRADLGADRVAVEVLALAGVGRPPAATPPGAARSRPTASRCSSKSQSMP